MVNVTVLSEQPILSRALELLLSLQPEFNVSSVAGPFREITEKLDACQADVYLVDGGPDLDIAGLIEFCRRERGRKVIVLTRRISAEVAYHAREAGVAAVISSAREAEDLAETVFRVQRGEMVFDCANGDDLKDARKVNLTHREGQLVALLSQGLKNKEIAGTLGITEGTVKVYLSKLFDKVGVRDRFELALFGLKNLTNPLEGFTAEPPATRTQPDRTARVQGLPSLVLRRYPAPVAPYFKRPAAGY